MFLIAIPEQYSIVNICSSHLCLGPIQGLNIQCIESRIENTSLAAAFQADGFAGI